MPGGPFHTQETKDVVAREAYRVDTPLQADGTLWGAGGTGICINSVSSLGGSQGFQ